MGDVNLQWIFTFGVHDYYNYHLLYMWMITSNFIERFPGTFTKDFMERRQGFEVFFSTLKTSGVFDGDFFTSPKWAMKKNWLFRVHRGVILPN